MVTTVLSVIGGVVLLVTAAVLAIGRDIARRRELGQFPETHKPTDSNDTTGGPR